MRIAIVGNFGLGYKGTMAARALPIARELSRRGHEVEIFLPDDGTSSIGDIDRVRMRPIGVPATAMVHAGPSPDSTGQRANVGLVNLTNLAFMLPWRALRSNPDVIYAFKPIAFSGLCLLAAWALGQAGRRRLLVVDADDWEGSGGWADRDGASVVRRTIVDWQEQWCLTHADLVTVASRALEATIPPARRPVVYAPNAASSDSPGWRVGDASALRKTLGLTIQPIVLAYTRFVEFSPVRLAEVAFRILTRAPDAELVVAGLGLAGEERRFDRLAIEHGLAGRVHLLGWIKAEDLPDVFAAADLALYPLDDTLLNRAKCPMKLVDLLLAGVPVVADSVGQAREYVQDGVTGALVAAGDVDAMANRAIDLLNDRARRLDLGARARQCMLSDWTWSKQADAIDEALRDAAARLARKER
jgi:glycosyltransferase involved in cell wall biosynthesis